MLPIALVCIGLLIYFAHPGKATYPAEDKAYHDIWDTARRIYGDGRKNEALHFSDSMYALHTTVSPYGMYLKYTNLSLLYNKEGSLDKSAAYADSALNILVQNKLEQKYPGEYVHSLFAKADAL